MSQPELRSCTVIRWLCFRCGYFETYTEISVSSMVCLQCGDPAEEQAGESCSGKTSRPLPYSTRPRQIKAAEPEYTFSDKATVYQKRRRN